MLFECSVVDVTPLRIPRVYRVKTTCSDYEVEIELHAEVVNIPRKESKITLEITNSKDECMKHYFCAHGYVVSNTQLGDIYRVVISLHGFLVVIKSKNKLELKELDHVYVGATY